MEGMQTGQRWLAFVLAVSLLLRETAAFDLVSVSAHVHIASILLPKYKTDIV